jgi:hypothetical protein
MKTNQKLANLGILLHAKSAYKITNVNNTKGSPYPIREVYTLIDTVLRFTIDRENQIEPTNKLKFHNNEEIK